MAVRRCVFNLIEIATSLDELWRSGRSSQRQIEEGTREPPVVTFPMLADTGPMLKWRHKAMFTTSNLQETLNGRIV